MNIASLNSVKLQVYPDQGFTNGGQDLRSLLKQPLILLQTQSSFMNTTKNIPHMDIGGLELRYFLIQDRLCLSPMHTSAAKL